jgi:hypothetical protein
MARYRISLFFISAALLALEISLMRVLKVEGWGNFTYTAIALALLGFGASGTLFSIWGRKAASREYSVSLLLSAGFILFLGLGSYLSPFVIFDPLRVVWDLSQLYRLLLRYLFYTIPFILGSGVILLAFTVERPGMAYFYNLLGSGFGVGAILFCLFFIPPRQIFFVSLVFAIICFILLLTCVTGVRWVVLFSLVGVAVGIFLLLKSDIRVLPYKGIELALNIPNTTVLERRYSPFGTLEVVASEQVRIAPGLSLVYDKALPTQHALFLDGDRLAAIDEAKDPRLLEYLLYQPQSVVYRLHESPEVFIVGLGGGVGVRRALMGGSCRVVAAEENRSLADLLEHRFGEHTSYLLADNRIEVATTHARERMRSPRHERWDIIDISEPDSMVCSVGGIYSTDTSYTLTREALVEFLEHLDEDGTLAITVWLKYPPRRVLKLAALSKAALDEIDVEPEKSLTVIRSWASATFLLKKRPFRREEIESVKTFCTDLRFDLVYYPGIMSGETNRYNIVEGMTYHEGVCRILKDNERFIKSYLFNINAPTDDRPYFEYFFRLRHIPLLIREMGTKWLPVVEGGYIILFSTFFSAIVLSSLLIILPLIIAGNRIGAGRISVLIYFSLIALSYMLVEISLIERFRRYLANPIYANSAILAALLLFSGVGSLLTTRVSGSRRRALFFTIFTLVCYFLAFLIISNKLYGCIATLPLLPKLLVSLVVVAPLGVVMGMPFPLAVSVLRERTDSSLPWAWSINGYFSVIASVGAVLISSTIGLFATGLVALCLYGLTPLFFPRS